MASPSLHDLLEQWEDAQAAGKPVTPEELCRECPERLPELRKAVRDLENLGAMLATGAFASDTSPGGATGTPAVPDEAFFGVRYRPESFHRQGGQGEVYVAKDEELNRLVALKRIQDRHQANPDIRRRFLQEAEINGRLEHPGIVPVYSLGRDAHGQPYYAMRLIQGQSLLEAIVNYHTAPNNPGEQALAFRKLLGHFVAVCNAVAYAHSRGVIHRDIKPANVMLGRYGETLLIDWGLAKSIGRTPEVRECTAEETLAPRGATSEHETLTGAQVGTPAYMSPEQAAGQTEVVGTASDIYSLGATLYSVLTGAAPSIAHNVASVLEEPQDRQMSPPRAIKPTVPLALDAVCRTAMAVRRTDRYASAQDLAADVERWLAGEPVTAWREPWSARARRWVRRHRTAVTTTSALIVATATGLGIFDLEVSRRDAQTAVTMAKKEVETEKRLTRAALDMPAAVLYDFACSVSRASAAPGNPDADHHAAQAVELLRRAIANGYADISHLLADADLAPLRKRPDYADLLWDIADSPKK